MEAPANPQEVREYDCAPHVMAITSFFKCFIILYLQRLSRLGSNSYCGFFGFFGRVLKVVFPNVSPVSVAGIFRGQHCPLKMPATDTGKTLGRTTFRTRPKTPKNPQQPLDPGCKSFREYIHQAVSVVQ